MFVLKTSNLKSKFGFCDGDIFEELTDKYGHIDMHHHYPLMKAVEIYLKPLLHPNVEIEEFHTIHNPARVTEKTKHLLDDAIVIHMSEDQIIDLIKQLNAKIS